MPIVLELEPELEASLLREAEAEGVSLERHILGRLKMSLNGRPGTSVRVETPNPAAALEASIDEFRELYRRLAT